ncbi:MAG: VCBS repeat-containing protein [Planctomycetales bacterium]|nr:VCBS repeat-containing protein [Planctomycetales bacterium]
MSTLDKSVDASTSPWSGIDDPSSDGWDSEVFSALATQQLNRIGKFLTQANPIDKQELKSLLAATFRCEDLLPLLSECYRDEALIVERMEGETQTSSNDSSPQSIQGLAFHGVDGMLQALSQFKTLLADTDASHSKFKVFRVEQSSEGITTRQYFSLSGHGSRRTIQHNATWSARWQPSEDGKRPRLLSISVEDVEQVSTHGAQRSKLFSDCTESALAGNESYEKQLKLGWNHWLERGQDDHHYFILSTPGLAIGDVDGDGLDDLYLCQEGGLPNRLFRQQMDGTLLDISEEAGVDLLENSRSALLVDLDNDGDQDLVVAVLGGIVIAKGNGLGEFSIHDVLPTADDVMSLSAADFDQDGRLDVYVCAYAPSSFLEQSMNVLIAAEAENFVYHDANNGAQNHLFRNETTAKDGWRFRDVTKEIGLYENNRRWSLAASWEDFDNDGDQDLYVANDYGRNNLYRNDLDASGRRRFADVAATAGVEDSASGMSVSWSDYDQDGWMDIYVSNMYSSAGNRIAYQERFKADAPLDVKQRLQRFARGNTLLQNQRDGTFADTSLEAGVTMGRWAWGSQFVDINNDGRDDLVVANGYITTEDTSDL